VRGEDLAVGDRWTIRIACPAGKLPTDETYTLDHFWMAADGTEYMNLKSATGQLERQRGQQVRVTGQKVAAALKDQTLVENRGGAWWWVGEDGENA
jgi:hypothetical protein